MADWVTGKVTKVQNWTDALFSLTVHAPVLPFTAGQSRSGVLPGHRPRWQIKPATGGAKTG